MRDINFLEKNNLTLLRVYRGSYVYGTYIEGVSDKDESGLYMSPLEDLFGLNYTEQINDGKNDIVFYELKRFLELLVTNNPNVLELLYTPEKFYIYKNPVINILLDNKDKFITKICKNSFSGYAMSQIKKAKGLDKKMNWESQEVVRKGVLDFCYVVDNYKTVDLNTWLEKRGLHQEYCGLVNLPHIKDAYAIFYDFKKHENDFGNLSLNTPLSFKELQKSFLSSIEGLKYKGIIHKGEISNDVSLSEIPKNQFSICTMSFNKDAYSVHCKRYKEYQEWLQNRNTQRYVDVNSHGQKIDGKNMLHCVRLIKTAREIAEGKGIIVERPDADELLKIRRGEVDLDKLIEWGENEILEINKVFEKSNLPDSVDKNFVNDILIEMRKEFYKINF
jgi:predicted nucleotidyltransferase